MEAEGGNLPRFSNISETEVARAIVGSSGTHPESKRKPLERQELAQQIGVKVRVELKKLPTDREA
jgi:hypothetical protein